ncbi:hypothetical protein [Halorhabdus rudnickae]|uniref:hypothetical protein n=1 Tax=Halorhabdus rudnickae TaxID=1775544 RepID=UPI00108388F7|nr:hypothetical protein [Halorhabdus rudnickae]
MSGSQGGNGGRDAGTKLTQAAPLAPYCSLCGRGYKPTMDVSIADEPREGEYRWVHEQCKRDHDRAFLSSFADE